MTIDDLALEGIFIDEVLRIAPGTNRAWVEAALRGEQAYEGAADLSRAAIAAMRRVAEDARVIHTNTESAVVDESTRKAEAAREARRDALFMAVLSGIISRGDPLSESVVERAEAFVAAIMLRAERRRG